VSKRSTLRSPGAALGTAAVLAALLAVGTSNPGYPDDRDLLRFSSSKPYLFIELDTSLSMSLGVGGGDKVLYGGGDNPGSRLYAAKQALFNTFKDVDDVFFGFASYNQDHVRVTSKHWVYYVSQTVDEGSGTWPIVYPQVDADGLTQMVDSLPTPTTDGVPETVVNDIEGEVLTLGPIFDTTPANGAVDAAELQAGSCASPLPLGAVGSAARIQLDTFALLNSGAAGVASPYVMNLWISTSSPARKFRVLVGRPANRPPGTPGAPAANPGLGDVDANGMVVSFGIQEVTSCSPLTFSATTYPTRHAVLRMDSRFKQTVLVDGAPSGAAGGNAPAEAIPNLWPAWSDAVISGACDSGKPFSGKGWEGNYDSNDLKAGLPITDDDRFCTNYASNTNCVEIKPVTHTTYSTVGSALSPPQPTWDRPLDRGDMLPFDWAASQREDMLKRFAPNSGTDSPPDFGVGSLLAPLATAGSYPPRVANQPPLIAGGNSPLGKAILDFRCWYLGTDGQNGNKCSQAATSAVGWHTVGCHLDPAYGCRKPYLIVISDGDDNCPGENPAADTAAMNSFSGIKTWALNVGDPRNCQAGSPLKSITTNGKGECINVSSPDQLLAAIQNILGKIREEARSFASAAVPSVQAVADQAIYLTNFTPLNNASRWPGHLNSFLKALPLTPDKKPDFTQTCPPKTDSCFVWDAGKVLATQPTRHVFYARESKQGMWAPSRRELAATAPGTPQPIRYDLWRAFGLISPSTADGTLTPAEELSYESQANAIIATTLALKSRVSVPACDPTKDLCDYKLGDVFHSDPLVLGQPGNVEYFKIDLGSQFNQSNPTCTATDEAAGNFDRGYRCFFRRHERRRQAILIGSNDGMLHAFNAAQFQTVKGRYDNGTGNELFAYMPRPVMPTVKQLASSPQHQFTVDGALAAADVFIDPVFVGNSPVADDRRWRTVGIGGLREGGRGYYALDITQPDGLVLSGGKYTPNYESGADAVPACIASYDPSKCGETPYGAPLWEFTDNTDNQIFANPAAQPVLPLTMDEDGNGLPDLGWTWSTADFARIQICESGTPATDCRITTDPSTSTGLRQRFVAIFGGGMDAPHKTYDPRHPSYSTPAGGPPTVKLQGQWLYMVDVETGQLLYKRQLCSPYITNVANAANPCVPGGAAPSKVAAVDTDLNGFVDRIYVGTIGGFLYRVDLEKLTTGAGGSEVKVPGLSPVTVNAIGSGGGPTAVTVMRIPETDASGSPIWKPRVVFDANWDGNAPSAVPRPIFYRPAVVINQQATVPGFAVAFGTGDREDLWNSNNQAGRFYLFMDDTDVSGAAAPANPCATLLAGESCPRTENDYRQIDVSVLTSPVQSNSVNLLNGIDINGTTRPIGRRGWFIPLGANEKAITDASSFVGVTFFSSFVPQVSVTGSSGTPLTAACGSRQYESNTDATCSKVGTSNEFLLSATNGNPLLIDPNAANPTDPNNRLRAQQVSTFVTNPFTEFSGGGVSGGTTGTSDFQSTTDVAVMDMIKGLFPNSCRFVNAHIDIKTVAADTTVQKLASIPVCLIGHSWKEF
jgi:Tfp pilus tip-associated adhesin PilY1